MNYQSNISFGSKQINLCSKDATKKNTENHHCHFHLHQMITAPADAVTLLSVSNCQIPFTYYQTNSNNNKFQVREGAAVRTVEIPEGNYVDVEQLEAVLVSVLNVANSTTIYNVLFQPVTHRYKFTCTDADSVFDFTGIESCHRLLGFSKAEHAFVVVDSIQTLSSDEVSDMTGDIHSLLIKSNLVSDNVVNSSLGATDLTLAKIPINCNPGSMILYDSGADTFKCLIQTNIFNYFELQLMDNNNNPVDLNGSHWEVTLQMDFHKKVDQMETLTKAITGLLPKQAQQEAMARVDKVFQFNQMYGDRMRQLHNKYRRAGKRRNTTADQQKEYLM